MRDEDLGDLAGAVRARLETLARGDVPARIWRHDHTVWRDDPTEITDRLGWLTVHREIDVGELKAFAERCARDGLTTAAPVDQPARGPG